MFMEVYKITVPGTAFKSPGGIESRDWTRIGHGFRVKHQPKILFTAKCKVPKMFGAIQIRRS
jgi:hypothetical protein